MLGSVDTLLALRYIARRFCGLTSQQIYRLLLGASGSTIFAELAT
jgi:hypothetical protein